MDNQRTSTTDAGPVVMGILDTQADHADERLGYIIGGDILKTKSPPKSGLVRRDDGWRAIPTNARRGEAGRA